MGTLELPSNHLLLVQGWFVSVYHPQTPNRILELPGLHNILYIRKHLRMFSEKCEQNAINSDRLLLIFKLSHTQVSRDN